MFMFNLIDIRPAIPAGVSALQSLHGAQVGADLVLVTRVLGLAYIVSPLRIAYAAESSGDHQIPGSDAHKEIRQLPCYAKGQCWSMAQSEKGPSALATMH